MEVCAAPGGVYTKGARAASGACVNYRGLCCFWKCLHHKGLCCFWRCLRYRGLSCPRTCLQYRGVSCTWTYLDYSSLCCSWTCLYYRYLCNSRSTNWGLSCTWMFLIHRDLCLSIICNSTISKQREAKASIMMFFFLNEAKLTCSIVRKFISKRSEHNTKARSKVS